ncbi:hypothetical protein QWZ10_19040 [Paracoccus cavernae]|uniref:H-NS histone family protein n=2 Tax=Paracoccus cavernae TaxID=1571207 RepID=A0ABT8DAC9_9RHOB|nr:hypothetical protein [Paracoccus cavernae]
MEPDALVDLERRLMAAKIEETAKAIKADDGLAVRLARAKSRLLAEDVAEVFDALAEAAVTVAPAGTSFAEEVAAAKRPAPSAPRRPIALPAPEPVEPAAPALPILPRPEPRQFSGDWSAPHNDWPERQAFVDGGSFENDPYDRDPLGFLANR